MANDPTYNRLADPVLVAKALLRHATRCVARTNRPNDRGANFERQAPPHVRCMGDRLKVFRVDAGSVSAEMIQHLIFRYQSVLTLVKYAVCESPALAFVVHRGVPAPLPVALPHPTPSRGVYEVECARRPLTVVILYEPTRLAFYQPPLGRGLRRNRSNLPATALAIMDCVCSGIYLWLWQALYKFTSLFKLAFTDKPNESSPFAYSYGGQSVVRDEEQHSYLSDAKVLGCMFGCEPFHARNYIT